jgi:predicted transcriptional regulator
MIPDHQNYYYNEYHEGLVELSKGFLNILLNQLVDKTMVAAVQDTKRIQILPEEHY